MKNFKEFLIEEVVTKNKTQFNKPSKERNLGVVLKQTKPVPLSEIPEDLAKKVVADGSPNNDKVRTNPEAHLKVSALKPAQKEVIPEKALGFALGYYNATQLKAKGKYVDIKDMEAIVSKDLYIMDGHHRWAAATLLNPEMEVKVAYVDMKAIPLITALNIYTKGALQHPGNEGKGDIENWQTLLPKAVDNAVNNGMSVYPFNEDGGMDGSTENIKKIITKFGNGDLNAGINKLKENAKKLNTQKLPLAPNRIDMPVIKDKDLKSTLMALSQGKMDILPPFNPDVEKLIPKLPYTINEPKVKSFPSNQQNTNKPEQTVKTPVAKPVAQTVESKFLNFEELNSKKIKNFSEIIKK